MSAAATRRRLRRRTSNSAGRSGRMTGRNAKKKDALCSSGLGPFLDKAGGVLTRVMLPCDPLSTLSCVSCDLVTVVVQCFSRLMVSACLAVSEARQARNHFPVQTIDGNMNGASSIIVSSTRYFSQIFYVAKQTTRRFISRPTEG